MKWCNLCKEEYEEFVDNCAECGNKLESFTIIEEDKYDNLVSIKYLTSCNSNIEADLLCNRLNSVGILTEIRRKGSGSYLNITSGINFQGSDIYIKEDDYSKAIELLDSRVKTNTSKKQHLGTEKELNDLKSEEQRFNYRRRSKLYIVLLVAIIIPVLISLFSWMYNLFL